MRHGLAEARGDTIQHDVDQVMLSHLGIDVKSISKIEVFLDSTYLVEIAGLVKIPVPLVIVATIFPNGILDFLPGSIPVAVRFAPH